MSYSGKSSFTAKKHDKLTKEQASAQIVMYEMLVMLPEKSHEGPCTPESGCDAACMENAHFCDYVNELYRVCGTERLSSRVLGIINDRKESQ